MKCSNCGAVIHYAAKFCPDCGSKLAETQVRVCKSCGAPLDGETDFCAECGAGAVAPEIKECKACGARLYRNTGYCHVCGAAIDIPVSAEEDFSFNAARRVSTEPDLPRKSQVFNKKGFNAKYCRECGARNPIDAAECEECGAEEFYFVCKNCGTVFETGRSCPRCGVSIVAKKKRCLDCGEVFYGNACPFCGSREFETVHCKEKKKKKEFNIPVWLIILYFLLIEAMIGIAVLKIISNSRNNAAAADAPATGTPAAVYIPFAVPEIIPTATSVPTAIPTPMPTDSPAPTAPPTRRPTATPKARSDSRTVSKEVKEFWDSYEAFVDEYIGFMEDYKKNPTDLSLLSKYSKLFSRLSDFEKKANKYSDPSVYSGADLVYSLEVVARIEKKLLKVLY